MAHIVLIEDEHGEVAEAVYFCSDHCAKTHSAYAGWNGCNEVYDNPQWCGSCGEPLGYWTFNYDGAVPTQYWVEPKNQKVED